MLGLEIKLLQEYTPKFDASASSISSVQSDVPFKDFVERFLRSDFYNIPDWQPSGSTTRASSFESASQFCKTLYPMYVKALNVFSAQHPDKGIKKEDIPTLAGMLVAQDGLESAWGKSYAGMNNFGNITVGSSGAPYTLGKDHDGNGNPITQKFRNYSSPQMFVNSHVELVGNSRYNAFIKGPGQLYQRIAAGGYAEDKNYVSKLNSAYAYARRCINS